MKITEIHRTTPQPGKAVRAVAIFDLEVSDDLRMFGLRLMEAPDGRFLIYAPSANGGRRLATFSPALSCQIADLAATELKGARDRHGNASGY
ncbi:hypothetical protein [Rhizobium sp. Leaf341]|jgi:hypothetical protein|uniref:hypothetical protein n=1 Tax=Rhizobium sp. Leaf341 TaxID=1736344 RepID=UPI000713A8BE|nr:hypothetical protein [Rhizobium sp. Leaf341]KQR77596.1 hypothetical protein ASG03_14405 [Rhizobium sp. Leaf341]